MIKLPFSRALLCAALASTVGLAGCDVNDKDERPVAGIVYGANVGGAGCNIATLTGDCAIIVTDPDANGDGNSDYYIPGTHPRWNPAANDIPIATDILFSGSTDGTASIDMTDDPTNPVYSAINDLDGWSTSAGIDVTLSGAIDPATVNDGTSLNPMLAVQQNVFLLPIETVSGGDPLDPADIDTAAPFNPATVAATAIKAQIASVDGGTNNLLRISPTHPLLPGKKYLVVVTSGVADAGGDPITRSANYDLLASSAPLADAKLEPLRDAVDGWEQLAVGFLQSRNAQINTAFGSAVLPTDAAALKSSLALTFTLTTTDPVKPLVAMGSARAAWFSNLVPTLGGAAAITTVNNLDAAGLIPTPKARTVAFPTPSVSNSFDLHTFSASLAASKATLYTGAITLPYYQTAGSSTDFSFLNKFWTANTTLISTLGITVPSDIPDGSGNDVTTNMTYRFPFAAKTGNVTVPIQTTLPTSATCAAGYPTQGFPVVIYVHGITSDRTSVIGLGHSLASNACVATVAIDLPMHGVPANSTLFRYLNVEHADLTTVAVDVAANERHFDVATNGTAPVAMSTAFTSESDPLNGSGSWFINLANLQNTRDNLRQAVMDLLNLNASLAAIDSDGDGHADFDISKVSVVGVSLGGIVATTFTTVNQLAIANDTAASTAAGGAFPVRLNSIKALAASVAGSELTGILENSLSFGPRIMGGLALNGATPGTSDYLKFLYVAQSTTESGDPVNFAETLAGLGVPVLLQEMVGGGDVSAFGDSRVYVADKVVPNNVTSGVAINYGPATYTTIPAPLAGTEALASLLGAAGPVFGANDASTTPLLTQMTVGHHASLLRPNENINDPATLIDESIPTTGEYIATVEMQTQVVSFIANPAAVGVGTVGTTLGLPAYTSCSYVVNCPP